MRIGVATTLAFACLTAALVAPGIAANRSTIRLQAHLTAAQQLPKPKVSAPGARGLLSASLNGLTLRWKLTYSHLTSRALAAHIHFGGRKARNGFVVALVCSPCRSGARGAVVLNPNSRRSLLKGLMYADVHTVDNKTGEIRAQIKRVP